MRLWLLFNYYYLNIPIAHIQAGDKSGHVDDIARAAIAKMANLHFASCLDSVKRLLKWEKTKVEFLTRSSA